MYSHLPQLSASMPPITSINGTTRAGTAYTLGSLRKSPTRNTLSLKQRKRLPLLKRLAVAASECHHVPKCTDAVFAAMQSHDYVLLRLHVHRKQFPSDRAENSRLKAETREAIKALVGARQILAKCK